jgi:hypothetical protein
MGLSGLFQGVDAVDARGEEPGVRGPKCFADIGAPLVLGLGEDLAERADHGEAAGSSPRRTAGVKERC